jgi:hypothetical protein
MDKLWTITRGCPIQLNRLADAAENYAKALLP